MHKKILLLYLFLLPWAAAAQVSKPYVVPGKLSMLLTLQEE